MLKSKLKEYLYSFAVITGLWLLAAYILKLPIVPSPITVYQNLIENFVGVLGVHVLYSLMRIFLGTAISLFLGTAIGFLMGYFKRVDKLLSPLVYFTYPVPKLALLPIVMLLFGLGEISKVIMIVIIIIFQIIITTRDAVKAIPKEMYYSLESLGASRFQIFNEIVAPATLAEVITSTRLALGTAVSILFFTETFGTEFGMGYYIMDSWMRVSYVEMYSGIVVLGLMGFCIFILIDVAEYYLCNWKR
jgi:NitT/TauT family transport system permease protein